MDILLEKNQIQPKILIVDDNSVNILLLEKMLNMYGYNNIKTLTDSREVIPLYTLYKPDILLLDLKMPYLDGFQVLEQLNNIRKDDYLPVIVITAQNDKENCLKALKLGARDFIGKPFDTTEVMMRIANMLEIRLLHNKIQQNNKELENKVNERTLELQNLQFELLQRLLRAAEFRDADTGDHVARIGEYAAKLGELAGFNDRECFLLMHASMMHDIGKISVPDSILLKQDKLNADEWTIMKQHTIKGAELLAGSSSEIMQLAEKIALTHHEKWIGGGYPYGIKGDAIPIEGRIVAICDVFDALLSERPYKKAWDLQSTMKEIQNGCGTHFDPVLAELFINNINSFLHIKEKFEASDTQYRMDQPTTEYKSNSLVTKQSEVTE